MVSPRERTFLERLESRRATRQPPRTRARRTSQATDSLPRTPAVEVFRRTHLDALELDPKCLGADLDGPNVEREERIVRVHEMPQASCLRRDFLEQLQSLRDGFGRHIERQPCDVATRPSQTRDQSCLERTGDPDKDDGNRRRDLRGGKARVRASRHDDVHVESGQLGRPSAGRHSTATFFPSR